LTPTRQRPAQLDRLAALFATFAIRIPGSLVEHKTSSIAFHYRRAAARDVAEIMPRLRIELASALGPDVELLEGRKVWEVRARGVSKRSAVELAIAAAPVGTQLLAVGDDRTDEDMFAALPDAADSIHIGPGPSAAKLRLRSPDELRSLLARLGTAIDPCAPNGR
jgi:trehalose 6-phosphate synthase/phosphatase